MLNKIFSIVLCICISVFSFLIYDLYKHSKQEVFQNRHILSFIDKNQNDLSAILVTLTKITSKLIDTQTAHNGLLNSMAERQQERTVLVSDIPALRREVILNTQDLDRIKAILLKFTETINRINDEKLFQGEE